MSDHISRQDAIEAVCGECEWERKCHEECQHIETLKSLPSAEAVDCTDFVLWLLDEIMDEENWELNAVANGEIIARKLKKLGLLEVKDGYYVRTPSAEAVQADGGLIRRGDAVALVNRAIRGTDNKEIREYLFDGLRKQMWELPSAELRKVTQEFTQDLISREELLNRLAEIKAPPEANEYKAEVYKLIQSM